MRNAILFAFISALIISASGCGVAARTDFPNALRDAEGNVILFDDVRDILNDTNLSDDEKRTALRELGLEDERLIDALIEA